MFLTQALTHKCIAKVIVEQVQYLGVHQTELTLGGYEKDLPGNPQRNRPIN